MTTITLATGDELFEARVRQAMNGTVAADVKTWSASQLTGNPVRAAQQLTADHSEIVVVGPEVPLESALELLRVLDTNHPEVTVMLVAEPTARVLEQALRAGVRDVVSPGSDDDELHDALERVAKAAGRRKAALSNNATNDRSSRVICVVSAKGGAGKTTVASNLAVGLAKLSPHEVVIVDLDTQFGDVATALRLAPEQSILGAARAGARLDITSLKAFLTPHDSGAYVLAAPDSPADADDIAVDHVVRILALLSDVFPYVVVDTPSGLDEHTLAALDVATDVVLLTSTDVPSVRAARKELAALQALGLGDRRWHVVLNRADARVGLGADDIELTVGAHIDVAIPSARAFPMSMNQGTPVLTNDERSAAGRALASLVARLSDVPVGRSGRRRFRGGDS